MMSWETRVGITHSLKYCFVFIIIVRPGNKLLSIKSFIMFYFLSTASQMMTHGGIVSGLQQQ